MVVRLVEADPLTLYLFWWRLCSDRGCFSSVYNLQCNKRVELTRVILTRGL